MQRASGQRWERHALEYLQRAGLRPVATNFHSRFGEIDLIMKDGDMLVFVEVRFRSASTGPGALESIDVHKQRKLVRAAQYFLVRNPTWQQSHARFDVIGIDSTGSGDATLNWLRDAFRAD